MGCHMGLETAFNVLSVPSPSLTATHTWPLIHAQPAQAGSYEKIMYLLTNEVFVFYKEKQ